MQSSPLVYQKNDVSLQHSIVTKQKRKDLLHDKSIDVTCFIAYHELTSRWGFLLNTWKLHVLQNRYKRVK